MTEPPAAQPPAAQPPAAQPPAAQPRTLLGVVERLLAGTAVGAAAIYVLINALYTEFYDHFGVRPEDVGWDRVAVLSRAVWVAIIGISAIGLIAYATPFVNIMSRRLDKTIENRVDSAPGLTGTLDERKRQLRRRHVQSYASLCIVFAVGLILGGFYLLGRQVHEEANSVFRGETVSGVGFLFPLVDVDATHAEVTWLDDKIKEPPALKAPYLMYLGRGPDVAVFLACGRRVVITPSNSVAIELLGNIPREVQQTVFELACKNYRFSAARR
jgi:hypothetical protein